MWSDFTCFAVHHKCSEGSSQMKRVLISFVMSPHCICDELLTERRTPVRRINITECTDIFHTSCTELFHASDGSPTFRLEAGLYYLLRGTCVLLHHVSGSLAEFVNKGGLCDEAVHGGGKVVE